MEFQDKAKPEESKSENLQHATLILLKKNTKLVVFVSAFH